MSKKFNEKMLRLLDLVLIHNEKHPDITDVEIKTYIMGVWETADRHVLNNVRDYLIGLKALARKRDAMSGKKLSKYLIHKAEVEKVMLARRTA